MFFSLKKNKKAFFMSYQGYKELPPEIVLIILNMMVRCTKKELSDAIKIGGYKEQALKNK